MGVSKCSLLISKTCRPHQFNTVHIYIPMVMTNEMVNPHSTEPRILHWLTIHFYESGNLCRQYRAAYIHLTEIRAHDTNMLEIKTIAGFLNYKVLIFLSCWQNCFYIQFSTLRNKCYLYPLETVHRWSWVRDSENIWIDQSQYSYACFLCSFSLSVVMSGLVDSTFIFITSVCLLANKFT